MKTEFIYKTFTPDDFTNIIELGNQVHGDGYLNDESIKQWYLKSLYHGTNASYVAYDGKKLIGFRVTFAINNWSIDQWCSPDLWRVAQDKVCYFKCNTIDEEYRGQGVGRKLLELSIEACKIQGATAGVSHLWQQSPNNSAVAYFTKCGGKLIKVHPDKWHQESLDGYDCILCGLDCHCSAQEMIIYFN